MIIILDGPDGSGKSSLARKMHEQTGYAVLHRSQPKTEEDKKRMMDEYMQVIKSGQNCIFDRCWYSEMVYGQIMRDASVISYPQMYKLERQIAKKGGIIVHCTGPLDKLWKRCIARGEDYIVDKDTYTRVWQEYYRLMFDVPHILPVFTYEYSEM